MAGADGRLKSERVETIGPGPPVHRLLTTFLKRVGGTEHPKTVGGNRRSL